MPTLRHRLPTQLPQRLGKPTTLPRLPLVPQEGIMTYQRNPLAPQLIEARQAHAQALERIQQLTDLLLEARKENRQLRADKIRLQARIADLKKYRPQAPPDPTEPLDEAAARLRAANQEVASWHKHRRATHQGYGRKKAA
jgi:DNA-binding protein H-NS